MDMFFVLLVFFKTKGVLDFSHCLKCWLMAKDGSSWPPIMSSVSKPYAFKN